MERFILDVLKCYTSVNSHHKPVKTVEGDPEFDTKKARKKLRKYVETHNAPARSRRARGPAAGLDLQQ